MKTTLEIQNLKCGGCAHTITTRLNELNKLDDIIVNPEADTVSFSYEDQETYNEVTTLLSKLGYPIKGNVNTITKKAKSFVSCAVGRINS